MPAIAPVSGEPVKPICSGRQWLDRKGGEDHVFDAEAGIDGVEPLFKESGEVVRVAAGASSSEDDPFDPAINAMKGEIEPPCSHPFPRQTKDEILGEPLGRAREIGGIGDRLGKAQAHAADRRLAKRRQWLGQIIKRLIETPRHRFAKPAGEGGARHRIKIADPLQSDPPQPLSGSRVEAQRFDRQWGEAGARVSGRQDHDALTHLRKAGQCPGRAKRVGNGDTRRRCPGGRAGTSDRRRRPAPRPTDEPSR